MAFFVFFRFLYRVSFLFLKQSSIIDLFVFYKEAEGVESKKVKKFNKIFFKKIFLKKERINSKIKLKILNKIGLILKKNFFLFGFTFNVEVLNIILKKMILGLNQIYKKKKEFNKLLFKQEIKKIEKIIKNL